jgi:outer membrane protein W
MNVTRIVAAFVAVGVVAGSAMAQTAAAPKAEAVKEGGFLQAGTIEYGGSFGYSSYSVESMGERGQISLLKGAAEVDYFVIDNLSVGLVGNVDWLRGKMNNAGVANATLVYGELVGRYHFPVCNDRLIPYVGASVGAGYGIASVNPAGSTDTLSEGDSMTTWGLQTGFLVPLNANVSLDTCIKYTAYQLPDDWQTNLDGIQIIMGFKMKL